MIIFLVSVVIPAIPACGDVLLARGVYLRKDVSGSDAEYLKSILRQLDRYARAAKLERRRESVTVICGKDGPRFSGDGTLLYLPENASAWREDFALRRKICGALASIRFRFRYPAGSAGVAPWILCGLENEIEASETSGRYLASNRGYPLLSGIVAHADGRFPDFSAMCAVELSGDRVTRAVVAEQARLLLNILAANGRIGEVFAMTCAGKPANCFLEFYSDAGSAAEKLRADGERLLWNRGRPMPGGLALRRLSELERCFVSKVDGEGKPTGELVECDWRQLAELLKTPRADGVVLAKRFAGGFSRLGAMLTAEEGRCCSIMAEAVSGFAAGDEGAVARFGEALDTLKKRLRRRIAVTAFLQSSLDVSASLPDRFDLLLRSARTDNASCLDGELEFFRQVIRRYLR